MKLYVLQIQHPLFVVEPFIYDHFEDAKKALEEAIDYYESNGFNHFQIQPQRKDSGVDFSVYVSTGNGCGDLKICILEEENIKQYSSISEFLD